MPIRNPRDFWSGVLFTLFGVGTLAIGSKYTLGTAARMGPGYFPRILGILLTALGSLLVLRALRLPGPRMPGLVWRPTVIVLASVVAFGLVVEHLELLLSTINLILLASTTNPEFQWKEALGSGIFFALLAIAVFVVGLKLQLPIWPRMFGIQ